MPGVLSGGLVRFRLRECSGYSELKRQTLKQLGKMTWILGTKGSARKVGFEPARSFASRTMARSRR